MKRLLILVLLLGVSAAAGCGPSEVADCTDHAAGTPLEAEGVQTVETSGHGRLGQREPPSDRGFSSDGDTSA